MKKLRLNQIILLIIYLALLGFFIYACLQNGSDSSKSSSFVGSVIANIIETITKIKITKDERYFTLIRKLIGHYGYFVILGTISWLFYYSFNNLRLLTRLIIHFVSGFIFAFFSEFVLEYFTEGRGASIIDVLIDYGGFCTLSLILTVVMLIKSHKERTRCS